MARALAGCCFPEPSTTALPVLYQSTKREEPRSFRIPTMLNTPACQLTRSRPGSSTASFLPNDSSRRSCNGYLARFPSRRPETTPRDERREGVPSVFTCPDCGGTLWELDEEGVLRFQFRTGDANSGRSMLSMDEHLESALRAAIRALEERRELLARLMARSRRSGDNTTSRRFERRLGEVEIDIQCVRSALASLFGAPI